MKQHKGFDWPWNRREAAKGSDAQEASLDSALAQSLQHIRNADPGSEEQWRLLHSAMHRQETVGISRTRQLVPAFSFGLAAAAILLVILLSADHSTPSARVYETLRGQHATVVLPDSSVITLNQSSRLTVAHNDARSVVLEGEAFFSVKHNGEPFVVATEEMRVQVLGTEFNIRARDGKAEVAVVSGRVRMVPAAGDTLKEVILAGGEEAACAKGLPSTPSHSVFPGIPFWLSGSLSFSHATLQQVCDELSVQMEVRIRPDRPEMAERTLSGTIEARSVEGAMNTLAQLTGLHYRHEGSQYVLY